MSRKKLFWATSIVLPLVGCLAPCAEAGSISGASITVTSVFNGQSPQQFTFSNITSTRIDRGVFSPWMPGISTTQIEFIPGTYNGDQTRNELDVDFDGSSSGYQFQPGQTLDLTFQLNNNLEFNPSFAALIIANDVQVPTGSINGGTLTADLTDLDQIDGNGGQLQYIFDVETMPEVPFSIDDPHFFSGGTATDPTAIELGIDDGYTTLNTVNENPNGSYGNGKYPSTYMNLASAPVSKGYFNYTGFTDGDTIDVLLKFVSSSGGDPITGQVLTDLVNYINDNNDGTITASIYNGDRGNKFPILDADNVGNEGWDILLQDTNVQGDPLVDFDFSQFSDTGVSAGSLEVAQIGIVPEPASLSLMVLGTMGLLIRRRGKKA